MARFNRVWRPTMFRVIFDEPGEGAAATSPLPQPACLLAPLVDYLHIYNKGCQKPSHPALSFPRSRGAVGQLRLGLLKVNIRHRGAALSIRAGLGPACEPARLRLASWLSRPAPVPSCAQRAILCQEVALGARGADFRVWPLRSCTQHAPTAQLARVAALSTYLAPEATWPPPRLNRGSRCSDARSEWREAKRACAVCPAQGSVRHRVCNGRA
eukprot:37037-Prymnesium_polylepis.1